MRFILEKQGKRFEYAVPEGNMIVGRDRKSDISIQDNNVSRHHMTVMRREEAVTIRDLGSRNGTFVNNERVTEARLQAGDIVRMGNLSLFFTDGSPGVEVPDSLGRANDEAARLGSHQAPTPPEGAPAAPPAQEPPPPAPAGPSPDPEGIARPEEGDADSLVEQARAYYRKNPALVLGALGGLVALLVVVSLVKNLAFSGEERQKKVMPLEVYDKFLDDAVAHFETWLEDRSDEEALEKARLHLDKIIQYRPERQTGRILKDIVAIWSSSEPTYDDFDWETAKRFLNELINRPECTPRAKAFAQGRIQWWRHEQVTRNILAAGDKAYEREDAETALREYRKLENYPKSRAYKLRHERIPELRKKIFEKYYAMGNARMQNDDWEGAIPQFEKAKDYATDQAALLLDQKIRECRDNIEEAKVFEEIRRIIADGDHERARSRLVAIPPDSKNYRQAQKLLQQVNTALMLKDGRSLFEAGEAEAAIQKLSDPLVFHEADAMNLRAKAKKLLAAFQRGDRAYDEAREKIGAMTKPVKITGFETAREAWSEVKTILPDEGSVYYRRAEEKLSELTNERIGGFYYDKVQALLDRGEMSRARDFLDIAREYDLSLGTRLLRDWREEAGKKYNRAINLKTTDKARARELLQWIVDALRPGDSDYYDKARRALGELE